jgi:preprotein translocase subunit SecD
VRILLLLCASPIAYCACSPLGEKSNYGPDWQRIPVSIELRIAKNVPAPGLIAAAVYDEGDTVYLDSAVQLANAQIARVDTVMQPHGLVLGLWLTEEGATRISNATAEHIGDRLAVLINSEVASAPLILEASDSTTKIPLHVGLQLRPEYARQLAEAVSKTWPNPAPK